MVTQTVNYFMSEIDAISGEVIDREMTLAEKKQKDNDIESEKLEFSLRALKTAARASALAKLAALGLTEDEAKAIVG